MSKQVHKNKKEKLFYLIKMRMSERGHGRAKIYRENVREWVRNPKKEFFGILGNFTYLKTIFGTIFEKLSKPRGGHKPLQE